MALVRDFELSGSGFTVPNAYHVIVNVKTEKRLSDVPPPPDSSREDGLTAGIVVLKFIGKQDMLVKLQF